MGQSEKVVLYSMPICKQKICEKRKSQCRGGSLAVAAASTATSTAGTRRRGRTTAATAAPVFPTNKELHEN